MWLFRSSDLPTVIDDLAEHSQVVLGFIPWRIADDGQLYGTRHELPDWSFDWSASWPDNVGAARHAARGNVAALRDAELLAHVEWIDESDVLLDVASAARRSEPHLPPDGYQQPAVAWLVEYSDPRDGSTCQAGAFASEAEARRLLERIEPDGTRCDVRLNIIVIHRTLEDWEWDR
jgi:hypothetical protein